MGDSLARPVIKEESKQIAGFRYRRDWPDTQTLEQGQDINPRLENTVRSQNLTDRDCQALLSSVSHRRGDIMTCLPLCLPYHLEPLTSSLTYQRKKRGATDSQQPNMARILHRCQ